MANTKQKSPPHKANRVSISLYPSDQERIREIQRGLLDKGVQVSDSEALRLALQTVNIDPAKFLKTRSALQNDLRKQPK